MQRLLLFRKLRLQIDAGQEGHLASTCLGDPGGRKLCGQGPVPGTPDHLGSDTFDLPTAFKTSLF